MKRKRASLKNNSATEPGYLCLASWKFYGLRYD